MKTLFTIVAFITLSLTAKSQSLTFVVEKFNTHVFFYGHLPDKDIKHLFRYTKIKKNRSKFSDTYITANGKTYYQSAFNLKIYEMSKGNLIRIRML